MAINAKHKHGFGLLPYPTVPKLQLLCGAKTSQGKRIGGNVGAFFGWNLKFMFGKSRIETLRQKLSPSLSFGTFSQLLSHLSFFLSFFLCLNFCKKTPIHHISYEVKQKVKLVSGIKPQIRNISSSQFERNSNPSFLSQKLKGNDAAVTVLGLFWFLFLFPWESFDAIYCSDPGFYQYGICLIFGFLERFI